MPTEQRDVRYATTSSTDVPRPTCRRCDDWTTVVHKHNVISPCPVCCLTEYEAWLADGNKAPQP